MALVALPGKGRIVRKSHAPEATGGFSGVVPSDRDSSPDFRFLHVSSSDTRQLSNARVNSCLDSAKACTFWYHLFFAGEFVIPVSGVAYSLFKRPS